jgi:uncharacterized protein YndB with AHSA1/START domain
MRLCPRSPRVHRAVRRPWYKGEALSTVTFVEASGKTTLTVTMRYESTEARDGVLASPMEGGVEQSYSKLAEILATLR